MNRLLRASIALAFALLPALGAAQASKPNIILITTDDQGYADLSSYGSRDIPTPFIDSIGTTGVRFTDGYITAPLCGPSRAAFITGQYQQKVGIESNPGARGPNLEAPRLPQVLREAGYKTAMFGKWHLGTDHEYLPNQTGFDYFWGTPGWGHYFLPPTLEELEAGGDSWMRSRRDSYDPSAFPAQGAGVGGGLVNSYANLWRNNQRVTSLEYLTDEISREAVEFIERSKESPFFIHVSYNAPHTPLQAPQRYLDRFLHLPETGGRRTYAAMVSAVDDGVGRILRKLEAEGLRENTLIFFFSDNGGASYSDEPEARAEIYIAGTRAEEEQERRFGRSLLRWGRVAEQRIGANGSDNGPLRFGKGTLHEGGIRVPFLVSWPAQIPGGQVRSEPVISLDLFPTAVAAAGAVLPAEVALDGKNLTPYLRGDQQGRPHETLYWRYQGNGAIRDGDWKLVRIGAERRLLYNLAEDIGEKRDLAESNPEQLARLNTRWEEWNATLPARQETGGQWGGGSGESAAPGTTGSGDNAPAAEGRPRTGGGRRRAAAPAAAE